jgi:hypothetical protein
VPVLDVGCRLHPDLTLDCGEGRELETMPGVEFSEVIGSKAFAAYEACVTKMAPDIKKHFLVEMAQEITDGNSEMIDAALEALRNKELADGFIDYDEEGNPCGQGSDGPPPDR